MSFWQMFLVEGVLLLSAGLVIFYGIRGTLGSMLLLSGINFLLNSGGLVRFWYLEKPLLIGSAAGIIILIGLSHKAKESHMITGFMGGFISLVIFGAFITPILALILWALVFGTGLIPKNKKTRLFWSVSPSLWRFLLALGLIIYGNFLF